MELQIYSPTQDGFIKEITWNHEEIKKEIAEKVQHYANLVYTDEQIKDAKTDRATLRKFVDALETKRKEMKKLCLAPYDTFEKQIKEIIAIVNEPIVMIDGQVKLYEEKQREEKMEEIIKIFNNCDFPEWVHIAAVFDEKWLNVSVKLPAIKTEMETKAEQITNDINTLANLPEFAFEAMEIYKTTLDINKAISEGKRLSDIQKRKLEAEAERKAAEEANVNATEVAPAPAEPTQTETAPVTEETEIRRWIGFEAYLSTEEALALREFFVSRNIQYRSPKK